MSLQKITRKMSTMHFISRLKMRHLRLLAAISETTSLRLAADTLGISQPSASALLAEVESLAGASLCERHARGMRLNHRGMIFARSASVIIQEAEQLKEELDGFTNGIVGTVTLGVVMAGLGSVVAPALAAIVADNPGIITTLVTSTSDNLLEGLRSGEIDLMVGRPLNAIHDDQLICVPLGDEPLCVIASSAHPLSALQTVTFEDLAGVEWILQKPPSPMRRAFDTIFLSQGISIPRCKIETSSIYASVEIIAHSMMCAMVPQQVGNLFSTHPSIHILAIEIPDLLGEYYLITNSKRPLNPAAEIVRANITARAIGKPDL